MIGLAQAIRDSTPRRANADARERVSLDHQHEGQAPMAGDHQCENQALMAGVWGEASPQAPHSHQANPAKAGSRRS